MTLNEALVREMYRELKTCIRKTSYHDKATAARTGQHVYLCRYCGKWHRGRGLVRLRNPVLKPDFQLKPHHVTNLRIKMSKLPVRRQTHLLG